MPFHYRARPHDRSADRETLELRNRIRTLTEFIWWSSARKGELPGLPPLCTRWIHSTFEQFLADLCIKPASLLQTCHTFEVAPGAEEISPRTCRVASTKPRRLERVTRRTLGLAQAAYAVSRLDFTVPVPDTVRIKGRFGKQRPTSVRLPATHTGLTGDYTVLENAPLEERYANPLWGQSAFTVLEWRTLVLPRLIDFVDHLGLYLAPTGKTHYGLPIHQGWVPFTSKANGYDKPAELTTTQWQAWREGLIRLFADPTPSPNTYLGGYVPERDFDTLFRGKAAEQRRPFMDAVTSGHTTRRTYRPGPVKGDQCWTLTKANDVNRRSIQITLVGDLAKLTHVLRWALITRYGHTGFARSEFGSELDLPENHLPPQMRYQAQSAYLSMEGPAYLDSDLGFPGNAEGFSRFPNTFGFPDPRDPEVSAHYSRLAAAYDNWRKARTAGQTIWPPPLSAAEELGLVDRTPSGAIRYVYLPMRTRNYLFHEGGDEVNGMFYRPRQVLWQNPKRLHIPVNKFLRAEVMAVFDVLRVWRSFLDRRDYSRLPNESFLCSPLGQDYFHPVTIQTYDFLLRHVHVRRNPHNPDTGMPANPSPQQLVRAQALQAKKEKRRLAHEEQQAHFQRIGLDHLGRPQDWSSPYHPRAYLVQQVEHLAFIQRRRRRLTHEALYPHMDTPLQHDVRRIRAIQKRRRESVE